MALAAASQLVSQNMKALSGERILIVDSPDGELAPLVRDHNPEAIITCVQNDFADYRVALDNPNVDTVFAPSPEGVSPPYDLAIVYLPQGRERREMTLALTAKVLTADGRILVTGAVRAGIQSSKKTLDRLFAEVKKRDSGRRCAVYEAAQPIRPDRPATLDDWASESEINVGEARLPVCSLPGVFSHGRLDNGTRLLLETLEIPQRGRFLDFGCGCGVIGSYLHHRVPRAKIEMVDSSALAVQAARRTAELNSLDAECVYASDIFSEVKHRYCLIVSNPPFHGGVETDYAVVESFFHAARDRLTARGRLCVVANRFLKYARPLEKAIGACRVLADDGKYRVYEASKAEEGSSCHDC